MQCPNCYKEIKDTAKFCGYCGSKIGPESQIEKDVVGKDDPNVASIAQKKPSLKSIIIISAILGILVTASAVVFFSLRPDKEEVLWNEVATINTIASYNRYLSEYPEGKYVKEILIRKENITWNEVQSKNDKASYKRYLEIYPNGRYNNEAIRKLKEIEKEEKQLQANQIREQERLKKLEEESKFEKPSGTFQDQRDGKVYKWIKIGNHIWMAENLAYLPSVSPSSVLSNSNPHHYVYDYDGTNIDQAKSQDNYKTFGVLYNWPAANKSCPTGWHLSGVDELKDLAINLVESNNLDDFRDFHFQKLKASGTSYWASPNTGATNSLGFSALPAGGLTDEGFDFMHSVAGFWFSSEENNDEANALVLNNVNNEYGFFPITKLGGLSVRCVKD